MKGIDFVVSHRECANQVIGHLENRYGFRLGGRVPDERLMRIEHKNRDETLIFIIRTCLQSMKIYFNKKFKDGYKKVIVEGNDSGGDCRIIDRAFNYERSYRFNRPIMRNHRPSSHNDFIDSMAMSRHFTRPKTDFTNLFLNKNSEPKFKDMQITKTEKVKINGKQRNVTVVVLNEGKTVKAGYSVRMPGDKANEELGVTIALGRANKPATNLVDMELGKGLDKKFILYAIAEDLLKKVERGIIKIKGVK